jgi:copper(I)-binding protein
MSTKWLLGMALGLACVAAHAQVEIGGPWVRATPPGAKLAAGYLVIVNKSGRPDRLVGASSPAAARVETHVTENDGGIYRMREVKGYDVPAGGRYELKPGGPHLMLVDIKGPLKEGERVRLVLRFERAGEVEVEAPVVRAAPRAGSHAGH